jgi:hypothetical protein
VAESGAARIRRLGRRADAAVASPAFAYPAILILQLRVIWKVWDYRDLTFGDTAGYFRGALAWTHGLQDDIVWSPLYTNFLGTMAALFGDVSTALMVHRIAIVVAASLLVLALMRSLLGPALGLLVAAWWAILPTNFNVEYEVHLYGFLPILVAALVVSRSESRAAIGAAVALLLGTTLLLRNEFLIASLILVVAVVIRELRDPAAARVYARAYGIPLLVVAIIVGAAYWRSYDQGDEALKSLRVKHELNMCQVYAFNFQQRHPEQFLGNPFTDCQPLMQSTFGRPLVSFGRAAQANPGAVAKFVAWNAQLVPAGIQVSLFGATSSGEKPGYFPVKTHRWYALLLLLVLVVVLGTGLAVLFVAEAATTSTALRKRQVVMILLLGVVATTLVVALTQRPRPEYMYPLTLALMAVAALSVSAIVRWIGWDHIVGAGALVIVVTLCVAFPPYFHAGPRPIHDGLKRLEPVRRLLQRPGAVLVTAGYGFELCSYTAHARDAICRSPSWPDLQKQIQGGTPVEDVLRQARATVVYADPVVHTDPTMTAFLRSPMRAGWREVEHGASNQAPWSVLVRCDGGVCSGTDRR